ncbi:MAG TPA: response regulator transcription factor [Ktedonobacteraceae bacterium]|nr:response regulator transcription factor [Ktedonobacteraceae bacterium]
MEQITVLIVDDHAIVRHGLRTFLDHQPDLLVVGEAETGEAAVGLSAELIPDVVLMDLVMPGIGGVEAIRQIKQISPQSQIIALTSYHDDECIFPALYAGALSYVLKDIHPAPLVEMVHKAARGEAVLDPRVALRVIQELQSANQPHPPLFTQLSKRELEVLRLIATGLPNAAIAEELGISEKTVKKHVSNLLSKLHLQDRTQAAVLAWQQGVVRNGKPSFRPGETATLLPGRASGNQAQGKLPDPSGGERA